MSRNFELLQKLEQEHRSQAEVLARFQTSPASEASSSDAEAETEVPARMHSPDEVCQLVRRIFLPNPGGPKVVVFSSVERGAGCSWMAAHCAQELATQVRRSICLVDANLPFPALHNFFEVENGQGFAETMAHSHSLAKCVTQLGPRNLWLLTSGYVPAADMRLEPDSLHQCMQKLRDEFEYTIIDAPPWTYLSHATVLGSAADGVVLVLKANSSHRGASQRVASEIKTANIPLLGAVLNQRTFPIPQAIYDRL